AACAPAPCDAGATEVAADRDSPSSAPRSAGNDPPTATAKSVVHPADPSSACVLACCGSPRHLRSTTQSVVAQQSFEPACLPAGFHSYPYPLACQSTVE